MLDFKTAYLSFLFISMKKINTRSWGARKTLAQTHVSVSGVCVHSGPCGLGGDEDVSSVPSRSCFLQIARMFTLSAGC